MYLLKHIFFVFILYSFSARYSYMHLCKIIKTFTVKRKIFPCKIIKTFPVDAIPSAFPGCACEDFRRALCAFPATCPLLSHIQIHICAHTYTRTHSVSFFFLLFFSLLLFFSYVRENTRISSILIQSHDFLSQEISPFEMALPNIASSPHDLANLFLVLALSCPECVFNSDLRAVFAGPAAGR